MFGSKQESRNETKKKCGVGNIFHCTLQLIAENVKNTNSIQEHIPSNIALSFVIKKKHFLFNKSTESPCIFDERKDLI